jgi:hypothetical protein
MNVISIQGLYTSKSKKIHDLFRVSKAFFQKFHDIFVNYAYGYSEVTTTTPVINKSNMYLL